MKGDSFAEQVEGARGAVDDGREGIEMGGLALDPICAGFFEAGGEDLVALGVEDDDQVGGVRGGVFGEDAEGGDGDDLCAGGEGEWFCGRDADAEAGKGAGAGGDVNVLEIFGGPAVLFAEAIDGGDDFGSVLEAVGELGFGEDGGSLGKRDRADSAAGFDGEGAG